MCFFGSASAAGQWKLLQLQPAVAYCLLLDELLLLLLLLLQQSITGYCLCCCSKLLLALLLLLLLNAAAAQQCCWLLVFPLPFLPFPAAANLFAAVEDVLLHTVCNSVDAAAINVNANIESTLLLLLPLCCCWELKLLLFLDSGACYSTVAMACCQCLVQ